MTVSICYNCGSCGKHELYNVFQWGGQFRLCENCRENLERAKFKIEKQNHG